MKRKNDSIPKQHDKEDLGFLDDRIQLLDTRRTLWQRLVSLFSLCL